MRHLKRKVRLTKTQGHRKAILLNLAKSVFIHKRITTSFGQAKAVQPLVERIITYAKKDGLNSYRLVESKIHEKKLVKRIVDEIAPNYKDRNGGYTRVIKCENRLGDNAPMAVFELVGDFEVSDYFPKKKKKADDLPTEKSEGKKVVKKVSVDKN